jgi:MarR family transcriptional regulator, organic hydroperoxide resistance regulator
MVEEMAKVTREAREATELLIEILHVNKRRFQGAAKDFGLSPQQCVVVLNLPPGQTMPMNAFAEILMCDASNVTGIVDKLEARGLVRREQGEDRRVKVLRLTADGEAMHTSMKERMLTPPAWIADLERDDLRALRDVLRKVSELTRRHKD